MNNIQSRKLINAINQMDCEQREQLLRTNIYNHPLSELKISKATLLKLKSKLECCKDIQKVGSTVIRHILVKKRSN